MNAGSNAAFSDRMNRIDMSSIILFIMSIRSKKRTQIHSPAFRLNGGVRE